MAQTSRTTISLRLIEMQRVGQTMKQAPQRMHSLLSIHAVGLDLHAFDQLDAVLRRDLDAGAAVDAVVDVDLVLEIAQVAALGLLEGQVRVHAGLDLAVRVAQALRQALGRHVLTRDEVEGALAQRPLDRLDAHHFLAPHPPHEPSVHAQRHLAAVADGLDHRGGAADVVAGGEEALDRGHAALADAHVAPAVELQLDVEIVVDRLLPDRDQQGVAGLDELRALDPDRLAPPALAPAAEAVLHELHAGQAAVLAGDQRDRRAQADDLHALALGLEDLVLGDRDVLLGGADVDRDFLGAEAPGHACAVERREAGADDGDAAADRLLFAPVVLDQEVEPVFHPGRGPHRILRVLAAQRQRDSLHAAGAEQHRVEFLAQAGQRDRALARADGHPGLELDAEAQGVVQLDLEDRARQAELGDAVAQHAARVALALEHGHVVAEQREVVGGGDAGGPGADDGHGLAGGGVEALGDAVAGGLQVAGGALQVADVDRLAVARPAVAADVLAGPRADPPQDAGQHVGLAIDLVGAAVLLLDDRPDVARDVGAGRTGGLAGDVLAHPADVARVLGIIHLALPGRSRGARSAPPVLAARVVKHPSSLGLAPARGPNILPKTPPRYPFCSKKLGTADSGYRFSRFFRPGGVAVFERSPCQYPSFVIKYPPS
jgi:hypothetical protein